MLVITRKIGETILINGEVVITVVSIKGRHVRIGFNAPREIRIQREEIYQKVKEEMFQKS